MPPAPTLKRKTRITPHLFMHTTTTIPVVAFPVRMVIALRLAIALHHTACPVHKHVLLTTRFGVEPLKKKSQAFDRFFLSNRERTRQPERRHNAAGTTVRYSHVPVDGRCHSTRSADGEESLLTVETIVLIFYFFCVDQSRAYVSRMYAAHVLPLFSHLFTGRVYSMSTFPSTAAVLRWWKEKNMFSIYMSQTDPFADMH